MTSDVLKNKKIFENSFIQLKSLIFSIILFIEQKLLFFCSSKRKITKETKQVRK